MIKAISYAMEVRAPVIAKTVMQRCGPLSATKIIDIQNEFEYKKPIPITRKTVALIRQVNRNFFIFQKLFNINSF